MAQALSARRRRGKKKAAKKNRVGRTAGVAAARVAGGDPASAPRPEGSSFGPARKLLAEAEAMLERGDAEAAAAGFRRAAACDPKDPEPLLALSMMLHRRGNHDGALKPLMRALERAPERADLKIQLGQVLIAGGHFDQAEKAFLLVLAERADEPNCLAGVATVAMRRGQPDQALALLEPHVRDGRPHPNVASCFGQAARLVGRLEEAKDVLSRALEDADEPVVAILGHMLGQVLSSLREYPEAFAAHARANAATKIIYDPDAHHREAESLLSFARDTAPEDLVRADVDGRRVLLIVGMPRSGTSLTEQILGRHPQVHPAGEREDLRLMARAARQQYGGDIGHALRSLTPEMATRMGRYYLERVGLDAPEGALLTDKMPQNYLQLALAVQILPGVRVVHCVRDARDTALSCFFQSFGQSQPFTTRLDWLGQRIVEQRRLMAELPGELDVPVLTLRYEELAADPEPTIRRLLEFAGLPFDEACLNPQESDRLINTASWAQVKSPIHKGSVGRAARYAKELEPLLEVLGDVR